MISCSLSPNVQIDDAALALRVLFMPWMWKRGNAIGKTEAWFRQKYGYRYAVSFNSGRSALLELLRSFGIRSGDEVIVQAFTCVAVPNSVRWVGAKPVFADIDDSYTLDPKDAERKITRRTRALIVQHTFGITANMDALMALARKHKLMVIEDCAHTMTVAPRGDAAFFSFGRDKVLSSVFGGMALANTPIKVYQKKLEFPSWFWIAQQLLHPVAFAVILPLYRIGVGKLLLVVLQKLRLLSVPVYKEEKKGGQPGDFPAKYPNALAVLLLHQLKKLDAYTAVRKRAVGVYGGEGALLRYPMEVENPSLVRKLAVKQGVLLGNWYANIIDPFGTDFRAIGYEQGSCPRAEQASRHIVNLPTLISQKKAQLVRRLV